MKEACLID